MRIYSDLHREFDGWEAPDCTGVDLVLLGGATLTRRGEVSVGPMRRSNAQLPTSVVTTNFTTAMLIERCRK